MKKLIGFLKPFKLFVFIIIVLLFFEAMCELSLPTYMSNIVNNGIGQGGVENATPTAIRSSEMSKIKIFTSNTDYTFIIGNYKLIKRNDKEYIKKYPVLKKEDIYILNDNVKISEMDNKLSKPLVIVYQLETNKNISFEGIELPSTTDVFAVLANMPKEQKDAVMASINDKLKDFPDLTIKSAAINYTKSEYKALGIDTNKIQKDYIAVSGLKMIGIALLGMILSIIVALIGSRVSSKLGFNIREQIFKKVSSFSNAEYDKYGASSLITRTTNDIQQVQTLIMMILQTVFFAPIMGIGGVIKVLNTDTSMVWIIALAVAIIMAVVLVLVLFAVPKFQIVQTLIDKLNLVTKEQLSGMLVIRAFNNEKIEEKKFEKANENLTKVNLFIGRIMSTMMPIMFFVMNTVVILIIWVGAHQIDKGAIQVGDMMAFVQYAMQIIMAFLMITMAAIMLPRALVSASRLDEVLNEKATINDPLKSKKFNDKEQGNVVFKDVSFRYNDADSDVIKNISFEAKRGQTTAFIGSTGSGKSTLINLIPRFYDVTSGQILVDGVNIKDVNQHDLREKIGYIPQKGILFSGTIASNLKYGNKDASDRDLQEAASIAQSLDFIMDKESKFDENVSQGGSNLSGGQKQRLSIARALVKKPEIYIFDDTFSALDFKTDANLRRALKKNTKNSTVLIVAQRIGTIINADQIIVLDEGKIVGKGTHKQLMEKCNVYKEIALSQLSKEELSNE